jgi:hypothetical protein
MTVALSGRVPVRVKSGLVVNSTVLANPGDHVGAAAGSVTIGRLAHGEDLPVSPTGELFAMVDLGGGGGGNSDSGPCNFGEIITYGGDGSDSGSGDVKTGIRGGAVSAGNIWVLTNLEINLAVDGRWNIWVRTPVVVRLTPLGDASLSGIASSSAPTWEAFEQDESDDTAAAIGDPVTPGHFPEGDGAGVAIAYLGVLTVANGSARFERSGCGDIIIGYCSGDMTIRRGYVDASGSSD